MSRNILTEFFLKIYNSGLIFLKIKWSNLKYQVKVLISSKWLSMVIILFSKKYAFQVLQKCLRKKSQIKKNIITL